MTAHLTAQDERTLALVAERTNDPWADVLRVLLDEAIGRESSEEGWTQH